MKGDEEMKMCQEANMAMKMRVGVGVLCFKNKWQPIELVATNRPIEGKDAMAVGEKYLGVSKPLSLPLTMHCVECRSSLR